MQGTELLRYLRSLVESDQYLFHGSPHKLDLLEPRQAFHHGGSAELNQYGVYATGSMRIALLYAVIHEDRRNWGWKWDATEPHGSLRVEAPNPCKGGNGNLYVLKRNGFEAWSSGINYIARKSILPWEVLEVSPTILEDLQRDCGVRISLPGTI